MWEDHEMETASIYAAEISGRGCENEDQLTSRVFGALEILPKESVLLPFIKKFACDQSARQSTDDLALREMTRLSFGDLDCESIELWKHIGGRYPDVCIETPSVLIVIEVKQDTDPYEGQLVPQFQKALIKAMNRKLAYFLLTKDSREPPEVRKAEHELKHQLNTARIHWRSWLKVPKWLREILDGTPSLDMVSRNLVDATIALLEEGEMMREPRIKEYFDRSLSDSLERLEGLTAEIRLTFRRVNEKTPEYGLEELSRYPQSGRREWFNYDVEPEDCWIPKSFEFYYRHRNWTGVKDAWTDPCLYVSFDLNRSSEGVKVGLWWDEAPKKLVVELEKKLRLKGNRAKGLKINEHTLEKGQLDVHQDVDLDSIADGELVDVLLRKLNEMLVFTEDLKTLREVLCEKTDLREASRQARQAK